MANFERLENNQVKFTLNVPAADFDQGIRDAYKEERKRYNVPGFRKGKAPRKMIENHFGEGVFYDTAFEKVYWEPYRSAVDKAGVTPVASPSIEIEQIGEGEDLKFTATVAVRPEITVEKAQYTGVEIEKADESVSDEAVNARLEHEREHQARWVTVERPVKEGDRVNLDYSGSVDGVQFDGGTAEEQTLDIGSGQFIPGFEEQLVGLNPGESKDIQLTFPEEYHAEDLAGKEAVFAVTINDIKEKELPELDDEFAKDVSDFDTLDEYKAEIRNNLEKEKKEQVDSAYRQQAIAALVKNVPFDLPTPMIDHQVDRMLDNMNYQLSMQGIGLETYFGFMGMDMATARMQLRPEAEQKVRGDLILEAIAKNEDIQATQEDIDKEIASIAEEVGKTSEEVLDMLAGNGTESIEADIKDKAALALVMDKAKMVKAKKPKKESKEAKQESSESADAEEAQE